MTTVKEMPRTKEISGMSLAQIREQLVRFKREGKVSPEAQVRLAKKMREIMGRLSKLKKKGGRFAQVQLSDEMKRFCGR